MALSDEIANEPRDLIFLFSFIRLFKLFYIHADAIKIDNGVSLINLIDSLKENLIHVWTHMTYEK